MRNLKRMLSLALAAVMLLGMMVVGASAASFPDVTSAENVEAINVMKAVSAMVGNEKGEFEPAKAVTRNEMAVVMCNLMGLKAEDYAATCVFTDVPDWAKNYVAACNANGIVSGTSATTYNGDDTVTAAEAGLMMMKALGYFQNAPDFGDDWKLATIKQASKISLFKGVSSSADTALTRNDVAQLGLTALKADVVEFNGTVGTAINLPDGTSFTQGYVAKYDAVVSNNTADYDTSTDSKQQLCEKLFTTSADKAKLVLSSSTDEFGRATTKWTFDGKTASEISKEAKFTFNTKTSASDVAKAMKDYTVYVAGNDASGTAVNASKKIENSTDYAKAAQLQKDASTANLETINNASASAVKVDSTNAANQTLAEAISDLTKNGKLVEIYANDDKQVTGIVTTIYTLNKVTAVTEKTDGDSKYTQYTIETAIGPATAQSTGKVYSVASKDEDDTAVVVGTLEKGSIVTSVRPTGSSKIYLYATTKFTGTQSSKDSSSITVGGESHKVALGVNTDNSSTYIAMTAFANSSDEAEYYVDQFGCVVKGTAVAVETKYAVVDKLALITSGGISTNNTAEALLVFTDGTTETVEVSKINGLKISSSSVSGGSFSMTTDASSNLTALVLQTASAATDVCNGKIVTYVEKDGAYELTFVDLAANQTNQGSEATLFPATKTSQSSKTSGDEVAVKVVEKGVPTAQGYGKTDANNDTTIVGDNNTIYIIKTKSGTDDKFTSYTGFKNVATVTVKAPDGNSTDATAKATYVSDDGDVKVVYIDATGDNVTVGETAVGDILYVSSTDITEALDGDDTIYTLKGIVNGEVTTLKTETKSVFESINKKEMYELTTDNDGYVTAKVKQVDSGTAYLKATLSADAGNGRVGSFTYDDATKVYVISDNALVEGGTIEDALNGDEIYVKVVDASGTAAEKITAEVIYIIKA